LHHRLVDLDLVVPRDLLVVRLELRGVRVAVRARDSAIRGYRARFEHRTPGRVPHRDVQPGTTRWITARQLVTGEVPDVDIDVDVVADRSRRDRAARRRGV